MDQTIEYPSGLDVEWIAVDGRGRVGVFTTAGSGPLPKVYLTSAGLLDQIWDVVRHLPEITEHELLVSLPRPDDFVAFAKRGLSSFDWADICRSWASASGPYEIQARPQHALSVDLIPWPPEIRNILGQVTSPAIDFDCTSIDIAAALECAAEHGISPDDRSPSAPARR